MAVRTYGDKPISFQVEDGGEFYCIGSEVKEIISIKEFQLCCCNLWINDPLKVKLQGSLNECNKAQNI